jgi:hypothetical protein
LFFRPSSKTVPPPRHSVAAKPAGGGGRFETECVVFFAEVVQAFGVPRSVGQIYGLLFATAEPLSFSDIVERLDISKGSISQGLQFLRSVGAINLAEAKRQEPGAKRAVGAEKIKRPACLFPVPPDPLLLPQGSLRLAPAAPRRDYYEPELSLRKLVRGALQERVAPLAAAGADRLRRLRELAEQDGMGDGFYLDRARQLEIWRRRLKTVLPVLTTLLGPVRGAAKSKA